MKKRKIKKRLKLAIRLLTEMCYRADKMGDVVLPEATEFINATCGEFDWKAFKRPATYRTTCDTPNDGNVGKAEEIPA